jgi:uncharacterized protein involved in type VI secretion and phage assembly
MTSPLEAAVGPLALDISLDGTPVPDDYRVSHVGVHLGLRTIGRATITFLDDGFRIVESQKADIGTAVTISAGWGTRMSTLFQGKVTAVASRLVSAHADPYGPLGTSVTLTLQDGAYELLRHADVETFTNMSLRDIVTRLVQSAGLSVGTIDLPTTPLKYAMRNDTALGLIDEIAQRTGRDWCVNGTTFSMWPAATGGTSTGVHYSVTAGVDLQSFSAKQVGSGATTVTVRGWDPVAQSAVVGTSTSPSSRAAFDAGGNAPTHTVVQARAATRSQGDADIAAAAIAARTGRVSATGQVLLASGMLPGGTLTVGGLGPSNGDYYVREVTHDLRDGDGTTTFVVGDRDPVQLSDPWASAPPASSFRRSGLAVGIVDNVQDPEKLGRVSVSLSAASDTATTAWARVVSLGAGAGRGQVVLPEVGDEVLIGFEDDDITRPVVLGGLFGKKSTSPTDAVDANGAVITRALTSRLGHTLEMADGTTPDTQHVLLATEGLTHRLRLGKDRADLEVPDGVPLRIASGAAFIEFDGKGGIVIDATTVTLKATTKVEVSGTDVSAKATSALTLQGTQASFKGTGAGVVEAGGVLEVKGAMVKIN